MDVDRETWAAIYRAFDHKRRLEIGDLKLYVERVPDVGGRIVDMLDLEPTCKSVLCGSIGSGKSTELVRLSSLLSATHAVVSLDLPDSVHRIEDIQAAEVLFLIGAAMLLVLEERFGARVDLDTLVRPLTDSFMGLVREPGFAHRDLPIGKLVKATLVLAETAVGGPGVAKPVGDLAEKLVPSIRLPAEGSQLGGLLRAAREGDPKVEQLVDAVDLIGERLREECGRTPVVLVDGLDKVETMESIRDLFTRTGLLARPTIPIVYTAPITLMLDNEWQTTARYFERERMTNVVVSAPPFTERAIHIDPSLIERGRRSFRHAMALRLANVDQRLRPENVFEAGEVERLITMSGGLVRWLIFLVRRAVFHARKAGAGRITSTHGQKAGSELAREFDITLNIGQTHEIARVQRHGRPGDGEVARGLLLSCYVLPYTNGETWFAPHPLLIHD